MPRFTIVSALPDRGRGPRQSPALAIRTNDARIQLLGVATRPALDSQLYLGQDAHERPPNALDFDKKIPDQHTILHRCRAPLYLNNPSKNYGRLLQTIFRHTAVAGHEAWDWR